MRISAEDRRQVEDAIRRAETRCGADFVCVLARRAGTYEFYPLAVASLLALAAPWPLLWLTTWTFSFLLLAQLVTFAVALLLLTTSPIHQMLVPRKVQRAAAHRAAAEQFLIRDLAATPARRGILLFMSHDERYARVLADDGAAHVVAPEQWRSAVSLMVAEAKNGRHAAGFVAALDHCAEALAGSAPSATGVEPGNALPHRFFVLD